MYARLCLRLSKEAPNFESPTEPCTFRLLLLNKCRDEFENRSKANDAFDLHFGPLGPEDEERRQNAKRKMLGNIKFIGELGKLEILGESILHRCIHQLLLEKNKKETGRESNDMTEDLELLCQIMRTCGRNLDIKGDKLMDQYFQRMSLHAENPKLPIRIRFMLRDVIELRMCRWVPREATSIEGPQPLHQIQPRDIRESSKGNHQSANNFMPKNDTLPNNRYNRPMRGGLEYNMGNYKNNMQKDNMRNGDYYGSRHQEQNLNPNKQNFHRNAGQQNQNSNTNYQDHEYNNTNSAKNDLPPHFAEKLKLVHQQSQINLDDLSLRPAPGSMMFGRANSKQNGASGNHINSRASPINKPIQTLSPPHQKDLPVKQTSLEKNKIVKKEKPVAKEPTMESLMEEYNNNGKLQDGDQKIPDKLIRAFLQAVMIKAMDKTTTGQENVCGLISQLMKKPTMNSVHFLDILRNVLLHGEGKEGDITPLHLHVSGYALHAISEGIVTLSKLSEITENGANNPLFLVILQELHKTQDEAKVIQLFNESKVNLLKQMPEADRSKEQLFKTLEDRNLGFLLPLLGIQSELWKQLQADPNPTVFYKWVKENVDLVHHSNPEFVSSLMTVILKYIILESTKDLEPESIAEKPDKERVLLEKFKPVLQVFTNDHVDLQVTALYALQTFCHSLDFPKGLLLRWFVNLYELEIVEEEAFLNWKENVTDEYPGKGKALFQVNSWLVWLEMTESEGEDEEED